MTGFGSVRLSRSRDVAAPPPVGLACCGLGLRVEVEQSRLSWSGSLVREQGSPTLARVALPTENRDVRALAPAAQRERDEVVSREVVGLVRSAPPAGADPTM